MQIQQLPSKTLTGIKIRTSNADEMNSGTAQITELWEKFSHKHGQKLTTNSKVYGVYTNYESDVSGEFDVIACCDDLSLADKHSVKVTTVAGSYLVFKGEGEMPDAVIDLWGEIWQYFSSDECRYTRTYSSDYEYYKSSNQIEIAIAVKE
ncbi:GyrI-like domain-containing protein [Pseudoalteromonas sp.]|jgi:predicted transcriptional regulator YdeE|uniref:GyrI-like domain-containing protein n=1 Tax=Pseudoalteromonas sp. TaxID=53249 RepID=UPI0035692494